MQHPASSSAAMLSPGARLGRYEILAFVAAGGMGEVYRAKDPSLNRDIAVKVLPADLAADVERRVRFEREARMAAALNHPGIVTIHSVEHDGDRVFITMELVKGKPLAELIPHNGLGIDKLLAIAVPLANAVSAAHDNDITHRDLKPANVIVADDGAVKVLDFGIAKRHDVDATSNLAATASLGTAEGRLLGTIAYMSPEQAEGKPADKRSDVFALGTMLYEMATGRRPFSADTDVATLAAIVRDSPAPILDINPRMRTELARIIRRAMAKDPDRRQQSAKDLRNELDDLRREFESGELTSAAAAAPRRPAAVIWLVLSVVCAAGAFTWLALRPRLVEPVRRLSVVLPPGVVIYPTGGPYLSPDGRRVLVVGEEEEKSRLWLRDFDRDAFEPLEGTEGASFPFWAPGGERIGFFADRKLKKVSLDAGIVETIGDVFNARGGAWGPDGTIIFNAMTNQGLSRVSAAGGSPSALTQLAPDDLSHRFPVFLPDGSHFLFTITKSGGRSEIAVASLGKPTPITLVTDATDPAYTRDGRLWFVRNRAVFAQSFDAASRTMSGTPAAVVTNVGYNAINNHADYSVSNDGTLAYLAYAGREKLTWIDRTTGRAEHVVDDASLGFYWEISPDGERLAYSERDAGSDRGHLTVWDMKRSVKTRLLPDVNVWPPCIAWSPAGDRLAVSGRREEEEVVLALSVSGASRTQTLLRQSESMCVQTWTPDGRYVLAGNASLSPSIVALAAGLDIPPLPLEAALLAGARSAAISPNGRWIAYTQREGARLEGHIQRFPPDGRASKFTPDEVFEPEWGRDGTEIFYGDSMSSVKSVRVTVSANGELSAGAPSLVVRRAGAATGVIPFFISADSQRILTLAQSSDVGSRQSVSLIVNWPALLGAPR